MAKFALYYIPPADHPLYRLGTDILGYDIRTGETVPAENPTRRALAGFSAEWVEDAKQYGLHVTTAGTYEYDPQTLQLQAVITACDTIFNSLNPANPLMLSQHPTEFLWMAGFAGLRYVPNLTFQTLHTALCIALPAHGKNSRSLRRLMQNPDLYGDAHHLAHRTQHYFTPYIFDDFMPHFTLLNPIPTAAVAAIRDTLWEMFGTFREITVESMCLVRLQDDRDRYEIVHEFHRKDYPQPARSHRAPSGQ